MSKFLKDKLEKSFFMLITLAYALSLCHLYYMQTSPSYYCPLNDLPAHISAGMSNSSLYSLTLYILGFLWKLTYNRIMVSIFLTLLTLLSIWATFKLLKYLLPKISCVSLYAAALVCNMYMPLFLPFFNDYRYLGLPSFVLYHNSTYIAMRPFALFSILIFLKLRDQYFLEKIKFREWIIFSFLMFITTWFKPNFIFGFAPSMLIIMIIDFVRGHGKKILNYIIFGSTIFPSIIFLLWQQSQLFNESPEGSLGFSVFKVWGCYARHPIIATVQAIAFPLVILVFNYKDLIKDKTYGFGWIFAVVNICIYAFIHENGWRQIHGNLGWCANFGCGVLFIISMYKFLSTVCCKNLKYIIITSGILGMHFLCWVNFYKECVPIGNY